MAIVTIGTSGAVPRPSHHRPASSGPRAPGNSATDAVSLLSFTALPLDMAIGTLTGSGFTDPGGDASLLPTMRCCC